MNETPKKIILYGCGRYLKNRIHEICRLEQEGIIKVLGVCDRSFEAAKAIGIWPAVKLEDLPSLADAGAEVIIMTAYRLGIEIEEALNDYGVSYAKISHFPVFFTRLNGKEPIGLRDKFTAFSHTCFAGILYNTLGLECCSPTKNLWMNTTDYLVFLRKIEHYLSVDPVFDRWQDALSVFDEPKYPVLLLDDIELYCNHYKTPEHAIAKWVERRKKVDLKDCVAFLITESPAENLEFHALTNIPYKYSFVNFECDLPNCVQIEGDLHDLDLLQAAHHIAEDKVDIDLTDFVRGNDMVIKKIKA